jgi:hypothetical protein
MTTLDNTLQPLRSALAWLAGTAWGQRHGYRIQAPLWNHFPAQGLWHLVPLCAVQSWEELPGLHPLILCLRIDLRFPAAHWPVVMVDVHRQCTTLASAPIHLALALLNHHLDVDGSEEWEQTRHLWRQLHDQAGGESQTFERVAARIEAGDQLVFSASEVDDRAAQAFLQLSEHTVDAGSLLELDSPWQGAVNSRVLTALTAQDIEGGGIGNWSLPVLLQGMNLLKTPAPYISNDFPPLRASAVGSAWYYLMASLQSHLLRQPSFPVAEGYDRLIHHGAEQRLSGLQHFELAAHESSVKHDQITAFHHLISADYWALEKTQTELPETLQMALVVARLQGHTEAVEALERWGIGV